MPKPPAISLAAGSTPLRTWMLLGPFEIPESSSPDKDLLLQIGSSEQDLLPTRFPHLLNRAAQQRSLIKSIDQELSNISIVFANNGNTLPLRFGTYAFCSINVAEAKRVWMFFRSNEGAKVWLNGVQCHVASDPEPGVHKFHNDLIVLPLKRGENLLALKIANIAGGWFPACNIETEISSALHTTLRATAKVTPRRSFLSHFVHSPSQPLELHLKEWPQGTTLEGRIELPDGSLVRSIQFAQRSASYGALSNGLYFLRFQGPANGYSSPFYIGSLKELAAESKAWVTGLHVDDRTTINLDTCVRRLEILAAGIRDQPADEKKRATFVEEIDQKAAYTTLELNTAINFISRGEEPFRHRTGLHLWGFRSRIDGQIMHYRVFIPSKYRESGPPVPLILIPATVVSTSRPFIESPFAANHTYATNLSQIAEKLNIGILWLGYRSRPYGSPVDFAHIDEVINEVSKLYHIDANRLTFWANSSAGLVAAAEVLCHPRRYAGMALQNAVMHKRSHRYGESFDFRGQPEYESYIKITDSFLPLARLGGIPIRLENNASDAPHIALIEEEMDFVEQAKRDGTSPTPTFQKTIVEDSTRMMWLADRFQKKAEPDSKTDFVPTSISTAFSEPFIVVEPTGGSPLEVEANRTLHDNFLKSWKKINYVTCRTVQDTALTENDEKKYNLILIGSERTNAIWGRLSARLPMKLEKDKVCVGEHVWNEPDASVQVWFPNPSFPKHKVVLIGSANPCESTFGTLELSLDGWYDCAVWKKVQGEAVLIQALGLSALSPRRSRALTQFRDTIQ